MAQPGSGQRPRQPGFADEERGKRLADVLDEGVEEVEGIEAVRRGALLKSLGSWG